MQLKSPKPSPVSEYFNVNVLISNMPVPIWVVNQGRPADHHYLKLVCHLLNRPLLGNLQIINVLMVLLIVIDTIYFIQFFMYLFRGFWFRKRINYFLFHVRFIQKRHLVIQLARFIIANACLRNVGTFIWKSCRNYFNLYKNKNTYSIYHNCDICGMYNMIVSVLCGARVAFLFSIDI